MQLPYFYDAAIPPNASSFVLDEDTSKHCIQVLRMKQGARLHITDGAGNLYTAEVADAHKKHTSVSIIENTFTPQPSKKITIAISLLKNGSRFEWFLEKAAELGIAEIIPVHCTRTEKQSFRWERMNNILVAAMIQSRQSWLCKLHELTPLINVEESFSAQNKFVAHCMEDGVKKNLSELVPVNNAIILIGPEGDFTPDEIQRATANGYVPVSLGSTRLRTETAGVASAVLLAM